MNTATATQPRSTVRITTPPYSSHVWTEEELRAKCMSVDESQRDLEQMIDAYFNEKADTTSSNKE